MHLVISVISNRDHKPWFTQSLCELLLHSVSCKMGLESAQIDVAPNNSILPTGRQKALWRAFGNNATHLLSIDDDMVFPQNALQIMASRNVDMIGVNAVCKNPSVYNPTAWGFDGKQIDSRGEKGIEEVARIGFGMVLINLSKIKAIPAPHFDIAWKGGHPITGEINKEHPFSPEDYFFCNKLTEHGIKIFVDHDVSQRIGHIGDYIFTLNSYSHGSLT